MPKANTRGVILAGSAEEIEVAFYEALQSGDIEQLMACWGDEDEIVCVHPGGSRLIGAAAIRASFELLFANGPIQAWPERVRKLESLGCSVHSVIERIGAAAQSGVNQAQVVATNVYLKTALGWRMVAHHASPGTEMDGAEVGIIPELLH